VIMIKNCQFQSCHIIVEPGKEFCGQHEFLLKCIDEISDLVNINHIQEYEFIEKRISNYKKDLINENKTRKH